MGQYVLIGFLAGNKLAVVEACAVVQEQLDSGGDDSVAVAVIAVVYLIIYLLQAVDDFLTFL